MTVASGGGSCRLRRLEIRLGECVRVHEFLRNFMGGLCLYHAAMLLHIGMLDRFPSLVQGLCALLLFANIGARWVLMIAGLAVAFANIAPWFSMPVYPWLLIHHPLANAGVFALCGLGWLTAPPPAWPPRRITESESGSS